MSEADGDEDEYKRKRMKNNISVQRTREKQKKLVENAKVELEAFKIENENLKDKYESLKKELNLYKSLFTQSNRPESTQEAGLSALDRLLKTDQNNKRPKLSTEPQPQQQQQSIIVNNEAIVLQQQNEVADSIDDFLDDFVNLPGEVVSSTINQQNQNLLHPSASYSSFNVVPVDEPTQNIFILNDDELSYNIGSGAIPSNIESQNQEEQTTTFFFSDDIYQVNNSNGNISNENTNFNNKNQSSIIYYNSSEKNDLQKQQQQNNNYNESLIATQTINETRIKYERKKTIPMPFHHEYAFIQKTSCRKK